MKKFLVLLFTSFLILGACSNKDSSSENSNKSSINKSDKNYTIIKRRKINQKRKRKNIRKILLVKKIKLAKNKHNYNKISHKCHNKITYNLHLKNKVLNKNNKLMLIINKLNKDTTMTTMAYIELLLNKST